MTHPATHYADVSLAVIRENAATIAALVAPRTVSAVLAADALGHGLVAVARELSDRVAEIVVADLDEAAALREAGIDTVIVSRFHDSGDLDRARDLRVVPVVSSSAQFAEAMTAGVSVVHVIPGIGADEPGIPHDQLAQLLESRADSAPRVQALVLPQTTSAGVAQQFVSLLSAHGDAPRLVSMGWEPGDDLEGFGAAWVGAPLFGLSARQDTPEFENLPRALTLYGQIMSLKAVPHGVGVSYGYRYSTPADTVLAMVSLGYADGVDRAAGGIVHFAVGGVVLPISGRVAMDACVIDIGTTAVRVGEYASVFGAGTDELSPQAWARALETTSEEVVARIAARVPRRHS